MCGKGPKYGAANRSSSMPYLKKYMPSLICLSDHFIFKTEAERENLAESVENPIRDKGHL